MFRGQFNFTSLSKRQDAKQYLLKVLPVGRSREEIANFMRIAHGVDQDNTVIHSLPESCPEHICQVPHSLNKYSLSKRNFSGAILSLV